MVDVPVSPPIPAYVPSKPALQTAGAMCAAYVGVASRWQPDKAELSDGQFQRVGDVDEQNIGARFCRPDAVVHICYDSQGSRLCQRMHAEWLTFACPCATLDVGGGYADRGYPS
jgi:hypothetical protein